MTLLVISLNPRTTTKLLIPWAMPLTLKCSDFYFHLNLLNLVDAYPKVTCNGNRMQLSSWGLRVLFKDITVLASWYLKLQPCNQYPKTSTTEPLLPTTIPLALCVPQMQVVLDKRLSSKCESHYILYENRVVQSETNEVYIFSSPLVLSMPHVSVWHGLMIIWLVYFNKYSEDDKHDITLTNTHSGRTG